MPRLAPVVVDFGALAESYLLACRAEGKSGQTVTWYSQKLRAFAGWLATEERVTDAAAVTPAHVRRFLDHLRSSAEPWAGNPFVPTRTGGRLSSYTVKGYAQVFKGFYAWLVREGHLPAHPVAGLRMPKVTTKLVTPLDPEEAARLLAAPDPRTVTGIRDAAILSIFVDCGLRVSELVGLDEVDLNTRAGTLKVLGKGSKERVVPFGAATGRALARWLGVRATLVRDGTNTDHVFLDQYGRPMSRHAVEAMVGVQGERAGLGRVWPHRLRHTFAVSFLRAGGDAFTLQRLLGHTSLATTRLYVELAERDVINVYRRASPVDHLPAVTRRARR
jgi:integrase/recombinase XerC